MNFRYFKITALIGIAILSSCVAPRPVVRLVPKESKTTWENGKEFVSYYKNGFIVHCSYQGMDNSYLKFDFEVINTTNEDFLVCPEKFVMYTDSGKWDAVSKQIIYNNFPIYGIDPEQELLNIEIAQSRLEASQKNASSAAIAIGVLSIPLLVATAQADANDTKQHSISRSETVALTSAAALNTVDAAQQQNTETNNYLYNEADAWITNALRKTTISKDESVRGIVYFQKPDMEKFRDLRIDVPIANGDVISFNYRVNLYIPTSNGVQKSL